MRRIPDHGRDPRRWSAAGALVQYRIVPMYDRRKGRHKTPVADRQSIAELHTKVSLGTLNLNTVVMLTSGFPEILDALPTFEYL